MAAYYGFLGRGRAYAYLGGFNLAFEEASSGAILIGHAGGEAIDEGAREFHFLCGREAYKYSGARPTAGISAASGRDVRAGGRGFSIHRPGRSQSSSTIFKEIARVLQPSGDLLIANYSYRVDPAADPADIVRLANEWTWRLKVG